MSLWFFISYAEISEALVACALMVWLWPSTEPKRSDSMRVRAVGLGIAVLGGVAWVTRAIENLFVPSSYDLGTNLFTSILNGTMKVSVGISGIAGVAALILAIFGLALFWSGGSKSRALVAAIQSCAAPLVLFQQVTLLAYSPLAMIDHATNLFMIWEGGFQPLSNWFVFFVSLVLTVFGIRRGKGGPGAI